VRGPVANDPGNVKQTACPGGQAAFVPSSAVEEQGYGEYQ